MTVSSRIFLAALLLVAGLFTAPGSARAAESYDNCTGFIDSLPAAIGTQGVWCLRKNLATNITTGHAIEIAANNVTIDCNDFKIGGLAAGDSSNAHGIYANTRQNVTVRHCNIRGFHYGIRLDVGAGHLVEDNRLDNNLYVGIYVSGDNNLVQRNRVYDTGGLAAASNAWGIYAVADVVDNTVAGVFAAGTNTNLRAIVVAGTGSVARNNRVRGLQVSGTGIGYGISTSYPGTTIDGNQIVAPVDTNGFGISGDGVSTTVCSNNVVVAFSSAIDQCANGGGNTTL